MKFEVNAKEFKDIVRACASACSRDESRMALTAIEMRASGESLTLTALDGFRMVEKVIRVDPHDENTGTCVVKPQGLLAVIGGSKGKVLVEADPNALNVTSEIMAAKIPVISSGFIDTSKVWPVGDREKTEIAVNPAYMAEVLKSLTSLAGCVVLEIPHNPVAPILLRQASGEGRALVLPIRLNAAN